MRRPVTRSLSERRTAVRLTLQPLPGVDPIRALRWVLKGLLRQHGMRCVDLREEKSNECDAGFQSRQSIRAADQSLINELIERAEPPQRELPPVSRRQLRSAPSACARSSLIGCAIRNSRRRIKDIFARGHFFEDVTRQHLVAAGFKFAPPERLEFSAADGLFRGHADGILVDGPAAAGAALSLPLGAQVLSMPKAGERSSATA